jgi:hypothetical protein
LLVWMSVTRRLPVRLPSMMDKSDRSGDTESISEAG